MVPTQHIENKSQSNQSRRIRSFVLQTFALLALADPGFEASGQVASDLPSIGSGQFVLEGTVVDTEGRGIQMARLVLSPKKAPIGQTTFTDEDARFFFYRLRPGTYSLTVSAADFRTATRSVDLSFGSQNLRIVLRRSEAAEGSDRPGGVIHTEVLRIPEKAQESYLKGRRHLGDQRPEKAVREFRFAIKEHPEFAEAHSALGIAYIQLKKHTQAREAFEKCLMLREDVGEAHLGLGLLRNDRKDYLEAEQHLLRARELLPKDWRVFYELGRSYYHQDRLVEAEQTLTTARDWYPDYGNLRLLLANTLALQDRLEEALAEMQAFLEVAPGSPLASQVRQKIQLIEAELTRR